MVEQLICNQQVVGSNPTAGFLSKGCNWELREPLAYRYLKWFYETVLLLHELLHETGSFYVHLDYHVAHYAKAILDEIFGGDRFLNQIIWKRTSSHNEATRYGNVHDILLFYAKTEGYIWNRVFQPYDAQYVEQYYRYREPNGRRFMSDNLTGAGEGPARTFGERGELKPAKGVKTSSF